MFLYRVSLEQELDGFSFRLHEVVVHGVVDLPGLVAEGNRADVDGFPIGNESKFISVLEQLTSVKIEIA